MLKGTKLYSIIANKCPSCHEGQFFETNNPYQLKKFDKMNKTCTHCGESFEREPGFYYGAMYGSYTFYVTLTAVIFWVGIVLNQLSSILVISILIPLYILLMPVFFRLGRLLWINIFVSYQEEKP